MFRNTDRILWEALLSFAHLNFKILTYYNQVKSTQSIMAIRRMCLNLYFMILVKEFIKMFESTFHIKKYINHPTQTMYIGLKQQ